MGITDATARYRRQHNTGDSTIPVTAATRKETTHLNQARTERWDKNVSTSCIQQTYVRIRGKCELLRF